MSVLHQNLAIANNNGERLAFGQHTIDSCLVVFFLQVLQIVVAILVDAMVTEAINRTQRVIQLYTQGPVATVGNTPRRTGFTRTVNSLPSVQAFQHALIHFLQQVRVLSDIETHIH